MHYLKNLTNYALIFREFGRKTQFGNYEKIFKKFSYDNCENALF